MVDENDTILGEASRQNAHHEGLLHRVAVTYLINDAEEILINERADNGLLDHSSAGHVDVGESYLEAAKRELKEELGVANIELHEAGSALGSDKSDGEHRRHMFKIFICKSSPVTLKKDEVRRVYWAKPSEVLKDMEVVPKKYTGGFKSSIKVFLQRHK
ncbi:MAG: NUDIX domain-containing protein [Candidatus Sungbacteria bacterium]|nr:NUDIX domain-containing protein [Candidatus Sungbacteria bacterium]